MVTYLDQSISFYCDLLGFELKKRFGNHWADIQAPGLSIGLHPTPHAIPKGENLQIGIRTQNLQKSMAELQSKGVVFKVNDDEVSIASFHDPDQNTLYLIQPSW